MDKYSWIRLIILLVIYLNLCKWCYKTVNNFDQFIRMCCLSVTIFALVFKKRMTIKWMYPFFPGHYKLHDGKKK